MIVFPTNNSYEIGHELWEINHYAKFLWKYWNSHFHSTHHIIEVTMEFLLELYLEIITLMVFYTDHPKSTLTGIGWIHYYTDALPPSC